jgi:hypothetical protein
VAFTGDGFAIPFDGVAWGTPVLADPTSADPPVVQPGQTTAVRDALDVVSCASPSFCMIVDGTGRASTFDGSVWRALMKVEPRQLSAVSCVSSKFCAAVGLLGRAVVYRGSSWGPVTGFGNLGVTNLVSVSCASVSFCLATDDSGHLIRYDGRSWSGPERLVPAGSAPLYVSCPSTASCVAVDNGGHVLTWDGKSWKRSMPYGKPTNLWDVSCPSTSFCAAVVDGGYVGTARLTSS